MVAGDDVYSWRPLVTPRFTVCVNGVPPPLGSVNRKIADIADEGPPTALATGAWRLRGPQITTARSGTGVAGGGVGVGVGVAAGVGVPPCFGSLLPPPHPALISR